MKRFTYSQNNSGGVYDFPKWTGPADLGGVFTAAHHRRFAEDVDVWVMAESAAEADMLAKKHAGVYFDGCASGRDCDCCGDRWHRATSVWG